MTEGIPEHLNAKPIRSEGYDCFHQRQTRLSRRPSRQIWSAELAVICLPTYTLLGGSGTDMSETTVKEKITHQWYTRPVLFVADVKRALQFYVEMLGFEKSWHECDGAGGVCQVNRAGCEIILCEHATRRDKGRLFVSLTADGVTALRREIAERSVPSEKSWWGFDVIKIVDPDGNELLFPQHE
jgi:catechol 2,3-dioxygenase-like lactoylglutathione lyase family enzyme